MDGSIRFDIKAKPGVSNLLSVLSATTGEPIPALEARFEGQGYGHLKTAVAEAVIECLKPVQSRYSEIRQDLGYLQGVLRDGAARASVRADATLKQVHEALGFIPE
jgi:tryptophanyl-tRNA synthetase